MRTIVKWSKPAMFLIVASVLLAAVVLTQKAHAEAMAQVSQSQSEVSKIKSHLEQVRSEKAELAEVAESRDARIQQLEKENSDLKE